MYNIMFNHFLRAIVIPVCCVMLVPIKTGAQNTDIDMESPLLLNAHTGIAVWDSNKGDFIIQKQSDHYFVPASNVKIATLYAAQKYLSDSLASFDYYNTRDTLFIIPKGDPSLLHPDFPDQSALDFLQKSQKPIVILPVKWETEIYGKGWAWDDYSSSYMPEKSPMPVNRKKWVVAKSGAPIIYPSVRNMYDSVAIILSDTLNTSVMVAENNRAFGDTAITFYSTARDSVCKKMMFDSDNFIAEQLLLMMSDKLLGRMNETKLIEQLLSDSTLQFPQKPVWVDGSGLSRYNLFTPEDMVFLLRKIEKEFGITKIKALFPTGNEGTLKGTYDDKKGFIYAKTGTLSGQIALSGYLTTKKNTPLIFSIMINNHTGKASQLRKTIAEFIERIWINY
jgi:D-alanyl-D-alanine carboxypeptidase/D-alanyl-D-alanine-endopeptidase (penicillin-binding protein 4)